MARHAACRYFAQHTREVLPVDVADSAEFGPAPNRNPFGPAAEFHGWMKFLDARERETIEMRFVEEWEYHEIAAAQAVPIGTVQWRVFKEKARGALVSGSDSGAAGGVTRGLAVVHAASRNQAAIDDAILQLSRTVASRKNESEVALSLQLT